MAEAKAPAAGQKKQHRSKPVLFGLLILCVLLTAGGIYYYLSEYYLLGEESVNVLCYGIDSQAGKAVPDAVAVVTINPQTRMVNVVALPATTLTGEGETTLQGVYAASGEDELTQEVQELLGVPIHHRVQLDYQGFAQLVESMGGVEVNVDREIAYRKDGEIVFHLEPGRQELDGEAALRYVRYLHPTETEEVRFQRLQSVVVALRRQSEQSGLLEKAQQLASLVHDYCETDIDTASVVRIANYVRRFDASVQVTLLPGEALAAGWLPDRPAVARLAKDAFHNPGWRTASR